MKMLLLLLASTLVLTGCGSGSSGSSSSSASPIQAGAAASRINGGSTARFSIAGDYLYTIAGSQIQIFNIADSADPKTWSQVSVADDIETLFAYRDVMFIGAQSGVFLYDIKDEGNPSFVSGVEHWQACDPVVAQGDYAFVTLNTTSDACPGEINQLEILDVSDTLRPILVDVVEMQGPKGLAVIDDYLFICDGIAGLKIFDKTELKDIKILDQLDSDQCNDIILRDRLAITTGSEGIKQYDFTEVPITLLSEINFSAL